MQARHGQVGLGLLLLAVVACDSSGSKDAGSTVEDGGADAGSLVEDAGTDAGVDPGACEKTQGVCAGARRARVDGAYELVCTARSYGADYEDAETRCDGQDNDCDGVTDPPSWSRVMKLPRPPTPSEISSLRTDSGILVVTPESRDAARISRLDLNLVLQGSVSVSMPWMRSEIERHQPLDLRLVRTNDGPVLHYTTVLGVGHGPLLAYLVPLDSQGTPLSLPGGGLMEYPYLDRPLERGNTQVAVSPSGDRLVVLWHSGLFAPRPSQVLGMVTDARGQVLVAPKVLVTHPEDLDPAPQSVLWLRNGELLLATNGVALVLDEGTVRVRRFDANLDPIGDERAFETADFERPLLVDLGPLKGGPLESPVLVLHRLQAPDWRSRIQVVRHLFDGGVPETWAEVTAGYPGYFPWFNALADEGVLRLSWLEKSKDSELPLPGGDIMLGWTGRLWTREEGAASVDRSPGLELLPLHADARWVLLEKLAPRRMGALYMTSTPEGGSFLDAVRYCTP